MNKIILIDTSNNNEILVKLTIGREEFSLKKEIGKNKAQVALPMIDELLKKQKTGLKNISKIEVVGSGPSFTGIRVGMTIANSISFALKIPVEVIK